MGVGGGQIYEEVNPTVDKQLSRQGYSYSPIDSPKEDNPTKERFTWDSWGCMRKLFPSISVERKLSSSNIEKLDKTGNFLTVPDVKDDLVVCAMMDLRSVDLSEQYKNRIYFKSEVVVRGDNYGGAMGTGLSTARGASSSITNENDVYFEYNLMLFKKEKGEGKIETGYFGLNFVQNNNGSLKFFIDTPSGKGLTGQSKSDSKISGNTGAGIASVDKSNSAQNKDLLQSISIYLENPEYAEFFGNDGNFSVNSAGFTSVKDIYIPESDNKGWRKISNYANYMDLSSSLKAGYAPFKNKKLKGMDPKDIQSQCYDGSAQRNHKTSDADQVGRDICYSKN